MNKPKIVWQHLDHITDGVLEDIRETKREAIEDEFGDLLLLAEELDSNSKDYAHGVVTQLGILPINNNWNPFNFWVGYTNFKITNKLCKKIVDTPGVEVFIVLTPYRFKVACAKYWVENAENFRTKNSKGQSVLVSIQDTISKHFETLESYKI